MNWFLKWTRLKASAILWGLGFFWVRGFFCMCMFGGSFVNFFPSNYLLKDFVHLMLKLNKVYMLWNKMYGLNINP